MIITVFHPLQAFKLQLWPELRGSLRSTAAAAQQVRQVGGNDHFYKVRCMDGETDGRTGAQVEQSLQPLFRYTTARSLRVTLPT